MLLNELFQITEDEKKTIRDNKKRKAIDAAAADYHKLKNAKANDDVVDGAKRKVQSLAGKENADRILNKAGAKHKETTKDVWKNSK